ncbi:DUF3566 domain-containing protein [Streptomyces longwoodensis]|uniref:DUF3566 domain-containing protein n=1 Tax=Streptomyces lasalocidi TaxID=324833 RepID=A0A4V6AVY5_STRLS|nr:DUF3566 domain-containing protein [Streptomyces lasalocidi]TKT01753.1 DUF3566 domain-containing protein [Streptomyces lasalocidi]WUC72421.1 DUF3566 domain-containing protein [Streptomyces longwoodensis]
MSGATGAGTSSGKKGGGGRGSAAQVTDPQTTNLKPVKVDAEPPAPDVDGSQGGTVTETRGPQAQPYGAGAGPAGQAGAPETASPLPGERRTQQQAGPYHPPQAYPAQGGTAAGAVRRPRTGARTTPRVRKARLRVAKADPWSVMKVSFLLSIALGVCTIVAAAVLWMVIDAMGVFSSVGSAVSDATGSTESNGFDVQSYLSLPHVLTFATIIAVIDVVLATALATLGAFIYNLSAGFVGGVELTLAEDE